MLYGEAAQALAGIAGHALVDHDAALTCTGQGGVFEVDGVLAFDDGDFTARCRALAFAQADRTGRIDDRASFAGWAPVVPILMLLAVTVPP